MLGGRYACAKDEEKEAEAAVGQGCLMFPKLISTSTYGRLLDQREERFVVEKFGFEPCSAAAVAAGAERSKTSLRDGANRI